MLKLFHPPSASEALPSPIKQNKGLRLRSHRGRLPAAAVSSQHREQEEDKQRQSGHPDPSLPLEDLGPFKALQGHDSQNVVPRPAARQAKSQVSPPGLLHHWTPGLKLAIWSCVLVSIGLLHQNLRAMNTCCPSLRSFLSGTQKEKERRESRRREDTMES